MIATAVIAPQVTGDEGIPRAICQVMLGVLTFDVLDVIAYGAHQPAEETGAKFVTKLL